MSTRGDIGTGTSKAYLQQIYHIRQELKTLYRKREQIQSELYAVRSPQLGERVLSSHAGDDAMVRLVERCNRMTETITKRTAELERLREEIQEQIRKVKHPKYRLVLTERYELCLTWEAIAEDMGISTRYVYMLHDAALAEFDRMRKQM